MTLHMLPAIPRFDGYYDQWAIVVNGELAKLQGIMEFD